MTNSDHNDSTLDDALALSFSGGHENGKTIIDFPKFPPFYSYLLELSEDVGIVDIYPWLVELFFYSVAEPIGTKKGEQSDKFPVNIIGLFVDDHQDNIASSALTSEEDSDFEGTDFFIQFKKMTQKKNSEKKSRCKTFFY